MSEALFVLPNLMPKCIQKQEKCRKLSTLKKYSTINTSFLVPISTPIGLPALQKQSCKVANYKISMYKKAKNKIKNDKVVLVIPKGLHIP